MHHCEDCCLRIRLILTFNGINNILQAILQRFCCLLSTESIEVKELFGDLCETGDALLQLTGELDQEQLLLHSFQRSSGQQWGELLLTEHFVQVSGPTVWLLVIVDIPEISVNLWPK